jgi:prepilin-type N-terminal cleavage/methylation domain-containing protein
LFRRLLNMESGYSLVEVMVSIIILTIAILPMVGMFDMGLRSATTGSNYDKARALANLKMEEAKSLPFATVRDDFPVAGTTFTAGYYDSGFIAETGPTAADFANFEYRVEKQYMTQPPQTPGSSSLSFGTSSSATNLIRVRVTVRWGGNSTYTAFGLVTG